MKPDNLDFAAVAKTTGGHRLPAGDMRGDKILTLSLEACFNGTVVLHCHGRMISRSGARSLSSLITEVLPTAQRMVLDLAGVVSLDSDVLGELALTHLWAEAAGYRLKFACLSDAVRQLFESTNLVSVLDVYGSVPDALAAMGQEEVQTA